MKVLLLQPPVQDFYDTDVRLQPIGLAFLKAAVKKHLPNINVIIKAYHHSHHRKTIPVPSELRYLKSFYAEEDKSPFSSFYHYYHFGTDFETIADEVAEEKPDLVGISSLFAPYYHEALECANAIKRKWPVPILFGGSYASTMPKFILSHPSVDFVISGEGEKPLVKFLKSWKSKSFWKIPGLGYKKNGKIFMNPQRNNFPINELPFPDLSDFPAQRYLFEKKPLCFIVTSRGCPYRCSFCSVHKTFGNHYRRRTTDSILAEMQQRYKEGYRVFDFEDDNFAFHKKETKDLCEKIRRAFPPKDIRLLAMNGICYWTLDREILEGMRKAGFTHLNLSLVSTNTPLLKTLRRPHSIKKYLAVVSRGAALGFKIVSYQILGLPGDSLPSMVKTMALNAKLPVLLGVSPFYMIPHAPISRTFKEPAESDILKARLTAMGIETGGFTRQDIYTLFITSRILNFLKGIPLSSAQTTLNEALKIAGQKDGRSAMGAKIFKRLLLEKKLYASTSKGLKNRLSFKPDLFFQVWRKLDKIHTLEHKTIQIKGAVLCD